MPDPLNAKDILQNQTFMMKDWSSKTWWVFLVSLRNYPNSLKTKGSAGRKSGEFQATFTSRMISWIRFFSSFHRKEPDVRLPLHSIIPRLACWVRSKLDWSPGEKWTIMNHDGQTHRRMMVWAFFIFKLLLLKLEHIFDISNNVVTSIPVWNVTPCTITETSAGLG